MAFDIMAVLVGLMILMIYFFFKTIKIIDKKYDRGNK